MCYYVAMKHKCIQCELEFVSYNPSPKFCSLKCKGDSQAPDIDIGKMSELYDAGMSQEEIGVSLGVSQKSIFKAMRRNKIPARIAFKRDQKGSKNDSWKGDTAGYSALHRRLYSLYGKPKQCSVCNTEDIDKHYDYANLTGNYQDVEDYAPMCRSCHWKYDKKIMNIKHMKKKLAGGKTNA